MVVVVVVVVVLVVVVVVVVVAGSSNTFTFVVSIISGAGDLKAIIDSTSLTIGAGVAIDISHLPREQTISAKL